jgi:hypothetical protein
MSSSLIYTDHIGVNVWFLSGRKFAGTVSSMSLVLGDEFSEDINETEEKRHGDKKGDSLFLGTFGSSRKK